MGAESGGGGPGDVEMAWKFPRLAWVLPRIKPWGPLETDPRETAEGHKLDCFLSVAGVMLGGGEAGSYH